jgi:hypothetical protein
MKHIDLSLYPLLLTLFDRSSEIWNSIMKYYWKVCLDRSNKKKEYQSENLPSNIQITTEYAYGILDDDFLKIKFEENLFLENYDKLSKNDKIINECWNMYLHSDERDDVDKIKDTFNNLKIFLFNSYKDIICELFQKVKNKIKVSLDDYISKNELIHNTTKWKIIVNDVKVALQVLKRIDDSSEWSLICTKIEKHNFGRGQLLEAKLINDNVIILLTTIGLFIFYFNEYNISLIYFYYMNLNNLDILSVQKYKNLFSRNTLPLLDDESLKLYGWALSLADNKLGLLKYGVGLFEFAIKKHNLELVEDIYKNCMNYFKQDLRNNRMFLSIITSAMPSLKEHFPKYIERYSLETDLIIDSPSYSIADNTCSQMVSSINLTGSNLRELSSKVISHSPEITFMVPYIKFVNYSKDYNWWIELLLPKPSLFVETMSKDNYKSLNGIALIMFKWYSFGTTYYIVIMVGHLILFISFYFVALADIQFQEIRGETRVVFLWVSIILGFFHLLFVFRQFVYRMIRNPFKKLFVKSGLIFGIKF